MNAEEAGVRWARLAALLEPIHARAAATARRLCRTTEDGDDLYQDTVLHAFHKLHTLRDEQRFRSWFFAVLLSRHRSRVRLKFWRRWVRLADAFPEGRDPIGEDGARRDEEARATWRARTALSHLPPPQREAVVLFEIDGYSIEEVASMQRVSISAVKSRVARGRDRLRRIYESNGWVSARSPILEWDRSRSAFEGIAQASAIPLRGKERPDA